MRGLQRQGPPQGFLRLPVVLQLQGALRHAPVGPGIGGIPLDGVEILDPGPVIGPLRQEPVRRTSKPIGPVNALAGVDARPSRRQRPGHRHQPRQNEHTSQPPVLAQRQLHSRRLCRHVRRHAVRPDLRTAAVPAQQAPGQGAAHHKAVLVVPDLHGRPRPAGIKLHRGPPGALASIEQVQIGPSGVAHRQHDEQPGHPDQVNRHQQDRPQSQQRSADPSDDPGILHAGSFETERLRRCHCSSAYPPSTSAMDIVPGSGTFPPGGSSSPEIMGV